VDSRQPTSDARSLIETPAHALGPTIHERIELAGRTFLLARPDAVDPLADDPQLGGATASHVYQPYWAALWPTARLLAEVVLREPCAPGTRALEIGCGLGLPGLAALATGCHVTFSDYDAAALRYVAESARLNGFDQLDLLHLDWHAPPEGLGFDVLLASDLFYESAQVEPIARLVGKVLTHEGICLLIDRDRVERSLIDSAFARHGLCYGDEPCAGAAATLYRIRKT
jgi:predicted nicotinamide N-methyase